jgi:ABC-type nitrate/sulfonate/bicarbonate transport system substrate-binding protein
MKIARLLRSVVLLHIFGFTAVSVPAQETIRVAIPLFPSAAFPLLMASDKGLFQKEGLTVEPIRINSAPTTYQALISGDVHAAVGAPTGLLPNHAQGADVIAVDSWITSVEYQRPADSGLCIPVSPYQLRGDTLPCPDEAVGNLNQDVRLRG